MDSDFEDDDFDREAILEYAGRDLLYVRIPLQPDVSDADIAWVKRLGDLIDRELEAWCAGVGAIETHMGTVGVMIVGRDVPYVRDLIAPLLKRHCPRGSFFRKTTIGNERKAEEFPLFAEQESDGTPA